MATDEEPKATPEEQALVTALNEQREQNRSVYQEILSAGANLDPSGVTLMRLDVLIQSIFQGIERVKFELNFEQAMGVTLENAATQVRQAKLTQGVNLDGVPVAPGSGLLVATGSQIK